MIKIELIEEKNKLYLKRPETAVVCGNNNYEVEIDFSSDWQAKNVKTALIIVKGQKKSVEFTGNTFTLPRIPNCASFLLIIFAMDDYSAGLASTSIEIEAIPTAAVEDIPEFEDIESYAFEILKQLDNLSNGKTKVKRAETSDVAAYSPNPNLLINGSFDINQKSAFYYYTSKDTYVLDRWMASEGMEANTNKPLSLTKIEGYDVTYFRQIIDYLDSLANCELCLSIKGPDYFKSMVVSFSETAPEEDTILNSIEIKEGYTLQFLHLATGNICVQVEIAGDEEFIINYIKLEYGKAATPLLPVDYATELAKCRRYRYIIRYKSNEPFASATALNTKKLYFVIPLPVPLRTTPTISSSGSFTILSAPYTTGLKTFDLEMAGINFIKLSITGTANSSEGEVYLVETIRAGELIFDAEIY